MIHYNHNSHSRIQPVILTVRNDLVVPSTTDISLLVLLDLSAVFDKHRFRLLTGSGHMPLLSTQ